MTFPQNTLLVLGAVLFFGLFLPVIFRRFHLPLTTLLILLGSLLGPHGIGKIESDTTLQFLGLLGASFMMLMAGFEYQTVKPNLPVGRSAMVLIVTGAMPSLIGIAIARYAGYDWMASLFTGAIFLSSSIMLVYSFVKNAGLELKPLGKVMKWTVLNEDLLSALLVLVVFKTIVPHERFPIPVLLGLLLSAVVILRMFLPEIVSYLFQKMHEVDKNNESELGLILSLTLIIIFAFSWLDVYPAIAAYLVGFSLSGLPEVEQAKEKLHMVAYSIFIPIFLFLVGLETDLRVFLHPGDANPFMIALVLAAIVSKVAGGYIVGRWLDFSHRESLLLGIGISPKLMVSLSMAFAAFQFGVVDSELFSAIILLSAISSTLTPVVMNFLWHGNHDPINN